MEQEEQEELGIDEIEMDTERVIDLNNMTLDDESFLDPKRKIQKKTDSKVKNNRNDPGQKKSTIFKEEYERYLSEEERKRKPQEGFSAIEIEDNSGDAAKHDYVTSDFNAKASNTNIEPKVSTFELSEEADVAEIATETQLNEDLDKKNEECLKSMNNYMEERGKQGGGYRARYLNTLSSYGKEVYNTFKEVLGGDNHNTNQKEMEQLKQMFDFILKYGSDVGMAEFTDQFNEGDENNLLGMYQTFKEKQDVAHLEILDEIDAMIPDIRSTILKQGEYSDIEKLLASCESLIRSYDNELRSQHIEYRAGIPTDSKSLNQNTSQIYNNIKKLLNALSRNELKVLSVEKDNNLLVKIGDKENYVNLDSLEKVFLYIKEHAWNNAMAKVCDEFNAKKSGKDENFSDKINKFKINVIGQIGDTNIFDGINNTIIGIIQEFNGNNKEKHELIDNTIEELGQGFRRNKGEEKKFSDFSEEMGWTLDIPNKERIEFSNQQQENSVSLWQRFKNFFTKTIPDFFRKVFGNKDSNNILREVVDNSGQFGKATNLVKEQQNELGEGITKNIETDELNNNKTQDFGIG